MHLSCFLKTNFIRKHYFLPQIIRLISRLYFYVFIYFFFRSFDELHKCTVAQLEKCKENTPANIIDALFKFARKTSPCRNYTARALAEPVKENGTVALKSSLFLSILLPLLVGNRRYV